MDVLKPYKDTKDKYLNTTHESVGSSEPNSRGNGTLIGVSCILHVYDGYFRASKAVLHNLDKSLNQAVAKNMSSTLPFLYKYAEMEYFKSSLDEAERGIRSGYYRLFAKYEHLMEGDFLSILNKS